jgi:hypothetical protein
MIPEALKQYVIKESVAVEGITEEYLWYHAKLLTEKMNHWQYDFEKLVKVMESRRHEHLQTLETLMLENRSLRRQLKERDEQTKNT